MGKVEADTLLYIKGEGGGCCHDIATNGTEKDDFEVIDAWELG